MAAAPPPPRAWHDGTSPGVRCGIDYSFDPELRERVERNLAGHQPLVVERAEHRAAAVGVVILGDAEKRACFVLTLRQASLRRHSGQWALPGGRLDAGESAEQAVLRELDEEIGLQLTSRDILGRLDDFVSRSGHLISPFVLWSTSSVLQVSPAEVAAAYHVPLADLDRPGNPRRQPLLHLDVLDTSVYAPTAAILFQFREVGLYGRPVHVADVEQPYFAWR